ncbi:MAG: hypothetical protein GQ526_07210 [Ardenticatenales bacterium]|nr:hypothetical protein [Ardenticatenales bacterium]
MNRFRSEWRSRPADERDQAARKRAGQPRQAVRSRDGRVAGLIRQANGIRMTARQRGNCGRQRWQGLNELHDGRTAERAREGRAGIQCGGDRGGEGGRQTRPGHWE